LRWRNQRAAAKVKPRSEARRREWCLITCGNVGPVCTAARNALRQEAATEARTPVKTSGTSISSCSPIGGRHSGPHALGRGRCSTVGGTRPQSNAESGTALDKLATSRSTDGRKSGGLLARTPMELLPVKLRLEEVQAITSVGKLLGLQLRENPNSLHVNLGEIATVRGRIAGLPATSVKETCRVSVLAAVVVIPGAPMLVR